MLKLRSDDAFVPRWSGAGCDVVPRDEMWAICEGRSLRSYSTDERVVALSLPRALSVRGKSREAKLEPLAFHTEYSCAEPVGAAPTTDENELFGNVVEVMSGSGVSRSGSSRLLRIQTSRRRPRMTESPAPPMTQSTTVLVVDEPVSAPVVALAGADAVLPAEALPRMLLVDAALSTAFAVLVSLGACVTGADVAVDGAAVSTVCVETSTSGAAATVDTGEEVEAVSVADGAGVSAGCEVAACVDAGCEVAASVDAGCVAASVAGGVVGAGDAVVA